MGRPESNHVAGNNDFNTTDRANIANIALLVVKKARSLSNFCFSFQDTFLFGTYTIRASVENNSMDSDDFIFSMESMGSGTSWATPPASRLTARIREKVEITLVGKLVAETLMLHLAPCLRRPPWSEQHLVFGLDSTKCCKELLVLLGISSYLKQWLEDRGFLRE